MTRGGSNGSTSPPQVNFTLEAHWRLVLRLAAEADGVSVPDLLRPVVVRYLKGRMRNEDLAEAVTRIDKVQQSRKLILTPKMGFDNRLNAVPGWWGSGRRRHAAGELTSVTLAVDGPGSRLLLSVRGRCG